MYNLPTLTTHDVNTIVKVLKINSDKLRSGKDLYDAIYKSLYAYVNLQYSNGKTDGVKILYNKVFYPFRKKLKIFKRDDFQKAWNIFFTWIQPIVFFPDNYEEYGYGEWIVKDTEHEGSWKFRQNDKKYNKVLRVQRTESVLTDVLGHGLKSRNKQIASDEMRDVLEFQHLTSKSIESKQHYTRLGIEVVNSPHYQIMRYAHRQNNRINLQYAHTGLYHIDPLPCPVTKSPKWINVRTCILLHSVLCEVNPYILDVSIHKQEKIIQNSVFLGILLHYVNFLIHAHDVCDMDDTREFAYSVQHSACKHNILLQAPFLTDSEIIKGSSSSPMFRYFLIKCILGDQTLEYNQLWNYIITSELRIMKISDVILSNAVSSIWVLRTLQSLTRVTNTGRSRDVTIFSSIASVVESGLYPIGEPKSMSIYKRYMCLVLCQIYLETQFTGIIKYNRFHDYPKFIWMSLFYNKPVMYKRLFDMAIVPDCEIKHIPLIPILTLLKECVDWVSVTDIFNNTNQALYPLRVNPVKGLRRIIDDLPSELKRYPVYSVDFINNYGVYMNYNINLNNPLYNDILYVYSIHNAEITREYIRIDSFTEQGYRCMGDVITIEDDEKVRIMCNKPTTSFKERKNSKSSPVGDLIGQHKVKAQKPSQGVFTSTLPRPNLSTYAPKPKIASHNLINLIDDTIDQGQIGRDTSSANPHVTSPMDRPRPTNANHDLIDFNDDIVEQRQVERDRDVNEETFQPPQRRQRVWQNPSVIGEAFPPPQRRQRVWQNPLVIGESSQTPHPRRRVWQNPSVIGEAFQLPQPRRRVWQNVTMPTTPTVPPEKEDSQRSIVQPTHTMMPPTHSHTIYRSIYPRLDTFQDHSQHLQPGRPN